MESVCMLRLGLRCLIKSIWKIRQSNFPWHFFRMRNWLSLRRFVSPRAVESQWFTDRKAFMFNNTLMKVSSYKADIIWITQISCKKINSNSLFLTRHKSKMIFGQTTPVNSDRKRKFQRFCPARSDCNNAAHGILSRYRLQDVFS